MKLFVNFHFLLQMKSMLTYLEGSRYKVQNALGELDSRPKTGHLLAPHITITRDKSGLQQSILKVSTGATHFLTRIWVCMWNTLYPRNFSTTG